MGRSRWLRMFVAVAAGVALVIVPAAQASSFVPNPGFELDCSGVPCSWDVTGPSVSMSRDTSLHHTGSASMRVTSQVNGTGAVSACFPAVSGAASVSYWYNAAANSNVDRLQIEGTSYTSTDCKVGGSGVGGPLTTVPDSDGDWHQATGSFNLLSGQHSLKLFLIVDCAPPSILCALSATANFDDVVVDQTVTAVTLVFFRASSSARGVRLRWRTGTEADTLGFHVYRERAGKRVRLDRRIVPAKGSLSGARYSFLDRRAPRGKLTYRLQAVDRNGTRTWYGPARVLR
jgi:hypothetical protein